MYKLGFYGAAGEVTGSCYLVQNERACVMVDFGMHQGEHEADEHNRMVPPVDPRTLDAVVLTHGHLDHCGRLPMLTKAGMNARVFATPATCDIAAVILRDAGEIQEADTIRENRRRVIRGQRLVDPLYSARDVEPVLRRFTSVPYDLEREIAPGISIRFVDAGHILGSGSVLMTVTHGNSERSRVLFSGDIGVAGSPILRDPVTPSPADVVVMESTYGDRDHRSLESTKTELLDILCDCNNRCGKIIIPSFAIGRTQDLIYHMGQFLRDGKLQRLNVFIDSPMATEASMLYASHQDVYDHEARAMLRAGASPLSFPGLRYVRSMEESRAINARKDGVVVIAASGMCTGGRVLHHLRHGLSDPTTHVVFVGFQGHGTLGRRLVSGEKRVRIFDEDIDVRATIHTLGGFSAHAGQSQLLKWIEPLRPRTGQNKVSRLFLTHGEDGPRRALAAKLSPIMGLTPGLPRYGDVVEL
jgi:metallo-beta-lactamase family protein